MGRRRRASRCRPPWCCSPAVRRPTPLGWESPPTTSAEPPGWVGGVYGPAVAAAGEDLVFAGNPCEGHDPVLRRADGTWVQLPPPPDPINVPVPVGDTVMLWGAAGCDADAWFADAPRLKMAMLSDDRREWRRLEAPAVDITSETEAVTTGWSSEAAVVFVDRANYLVDRAGVVTELPPGPMGSRAECVTADAMVAVPQFYDTTSPVSPEVGTTGSVSVLDIGAPDQGWQARGPVSTGTTSGLGGDLCGPDGLSLIGPTSAADYSLTADAWTTSPSNFVELAADHRGALGVGPARRVVTRRVDRLRLAGEPPGARTRGSWPLGRHRPHCDRSRGDDLRGARSDVLDHRPLGTGPHRPSSSSPRRAGPTDQVILNTWATRSAGSKRT